MSNLKIIRVVNRRMVGVGIVAATALGVTSCGSDDPPSNELIGSWFSQCEAVNTSAVPSISEIYYKETVRVEKEKSEIEFQFFSDSECSAYYYDTIEASTQLQSGTIEPGGKVSTVNGVEATLLNVSMSTVSSVELSIVVVPHEIYAIQNSVLYFGTSDQQSDPVTYTLDFNIPLYRN